MNVKVEHKDIAVIHHLSDLHIGPFHSEPKYVPFAKTEKGHQYYLQSYLNFLKDSATNMPDLILVSGDLTSIASEDEIAGVVDFIDKVCEIVTKKSNDGIPFTDKLCLVPGNHDINWLEKDDDQKIRRYRNAFPHYFNGIKNKVLVRDDLNIVIYGLDSSSLSGVEDPIILEKVKAISEVLKRLDENGQNKEEYRKGLEDLEKLSKKDMGFVSQHELKNMKEFLTKQKYNSYLKIVILHHNLEIPPVEAVQENGCIINAGQVRAHLLDSHVNIVLHGHTHFPYTYFHGTVPDIQNTEDHSGNKKTHTITFRQGIHFSSAPSMGGWTETDSKWHKLVIHDAHKISSSEPPSTLLER